MVNNEQDTDKKRHSCPYCDEEIAEAAFPYCEACKLEVLRCPACHKVVEKDAKVCPSCGAEIKG